MLLDLNLNFPSVCNSIRTGSQTLASKYINAKCQSCYILAYISGWGRVAKCIFVMEKTTCGLNTGSFIQQEIPADYSDTGDELGLIVTGVVNGSPSMVQNVFWSFSWKTFLKHDETVVHFGGCDQAHRDWPMSSSLTWGWSIDQFHRTLSCGVSGRG